MQELQINRAIEQEQSKESILLIQNDDLTEFTDYCFTVQVGNKSLINRHKFEEFLNQTTSL